MRTRLLFGVFIAATIPVVLWLFHSKLDVGKPAVVFKGASSASSTDLQTLKTSHTPNSKANHESRDALASFDSWLMEYLKDPQGTRIEEGKSMARERRPAFRQLIQTDPRQALNRAVPMVTRQKLPREIVALLEERVAAKGELRVYAASPDSKLRGEKPYLRYAATRDGRTYEANVYGRRETILQTQEDVHLIGVAMDEQIAISESPGRRLEPGEYVPKGKKQVEVCPISGESTEREAEKSSEAVPELLAVVETGDEVVYLCDGAHFQPYINGLIMAEAGTGGAQSFTGQMPSASVPSVGVVKVLYVPVMFADQGQVPASEATMQDGLRQVAEFYQTQSYGRLTLVATVTPPVRLPRSQAWYVGKDVQSGHIREVDGLSAEMNHAKEAARAAGYDWQDYHCFCVRSNGGARHPTSYGGGSSSGGGNVWMRTDSVGTIAHEIGHAFGLGHANFWLTNGASVAGPGGNEEYRNIFDNMGTAQPPSGHYNAQAKNQIRWMPPEYAPPITASGQYRIFAFDTPRLVPGQLYGLQIRKDAERTYWGEFRTLFPGNVWASNGLILGWKWPSNGGGNIQLLDTTPGSISGRADCPLVPGSTFSDRDSGIHITTLAVNANSAPPSLDVQVNLGDFPGNQAPTLGLTPAAPVVPTNVNVTFIATANDPDGDTLSYSWRWHDDVVSPNSPMVTRSFAMAGIYTLSCVVSDMKGGIAVRNAVITVGHGNGRFVIRGRITLDGVGMPGINVTTTGSNGTLTDNDGHYAISNLAAGTYLITPAGHGWRFNERFNNTVTVGPSFTGADFTMEPLPIVSLTTPVPATQEAANPTPAQFRLSRTGPINFPLTVYTLAVRGTATAGSDYSFSPDYTAISSTPYFSFTIPANSSFLDISVNPMNDSGQEGDENVELILGLDANYLNGKPASAQITVQDNDTALPRVSLTSNVSQVVEGSGQSITCTVTRTGATTAALVVPYTVDAFGTATNSVDYSTLSGSVTIPIGASSASFSVTPLEDSLAEAVETVRLSIASGVVFIADAVASSLSLALVDNDGQEVMVSVSDAMARETDRSQAGAIPDPGVFLLTRTGNSTVSLTVFYSVTGTALHGTDYEALPGSVTFPAGETQQLVTIMPRYDGFGEGAETVLLSIADGNAAYRSSSTTSSGIVTINDHANDKPLVEVTAIGSIAAEPSTNGQFRLTARGGSGSLTVNYTITGTATSGTDYSMVGLNTTTLTGSTTLTLTGGTVTRNLDVVVLDDNTLEDLENIVLTLTSSPDYTLWDQSKTATHLLRDDDQPTVFVDPQISTGAVHSVSESSTNMTLDFYFSRTGITSNPLTVNYTLAGTATNGTDYTQLSGTVTIPAGAPGVDVNFNTISDTLFEGTETVTVQLAPGDYARGPDATLYILDDDAGAQVVSFASSGSSSVESVSNINIPVVLSAPATSPVSVDYLLESGPRTPTMLSGMWVRVIRAGNSYSAWSSYDGVNFVQRGTTLTLTGMPTSGYLAGIYVTSGASSTLANVGVDSFTVTGLDGGGSVGSVLTAAIGSESPRGGFTQGENGYNIICGGPDLSASGSTDGGRMIYVPITSSANCIVTARVLGFTGSSSSMKAGVCIREGTANNARHMSMMTDVNVAQQQAIWRLTSGGNAAQSAAQATYAKPRWLRLQRSAGVFTASVSADGNAWTVTGVAPAVPLGSLSLVGLAASARNDNLQMQAIFDNVTLSTGHAFTGRTIGFVNQPGSVAQGSGTWQITSSGAGFMQNQNSTEDEGHMAGASVSGDFTLTARLVSVTGGAANAQAGLMVRESANHQARALWFGLTGSGTSAPEFRARLSSTSSGEGMTVDYHLLPGTLTFGIGEQTKNIVLNVTNDTISEPIEFVNVLLRYPNAAMLGTPSAYTHALLDDDAVNAFLPVVGFAGSASSGSEAASPVSIPITLSAPSSVPVTVNFDVTPGGSATGGGVDFTSITGTLTFAPGEILKHLLLPIANDALLENSETVELALSSATHAVLSTTSRHTFTIQDDDTPSVSITASTPVASEGGASGAFTVSRTGSTASALTVNFTRTGTATSGTDFIAFAPLTSISIPAGQSSVELPVVTLQDVSAESSETVIVTIDDNVGYSKGISSSATVTIMDDDLNTVTLTATDGIATEAGDPGQFTLTRTGSLDASLTVNYVVTGTTTNGTDHNNITTSRTFGIGVSSQTIAVIPTPDVQSEGHEELVISLEPRANYVLGSPSVANVTLLDDDLPPTVFISSPKGKSTIIPTNQGLMLEAEGLDDGLPGPLSYAWSQLFGPGQTLFGSPASSTTSATFPVPGVYGLRVTVSDGQLTASDTIFVQSGGFAYANWVGIDQGPPGVRGISGESSGGVFTLIGSGIGYSGTNDSGHLMFRQLLGGTGDCSITARLVSAEGASTRLAGITLRDTSWKGARRANLVINGAGVLQFRARSAANSADTASTITGLATPRWLRLERVGNSITASHAPDVNGNAGAWTQVGTSTAIQMGANVVVGMVVSAGTQTPLTATAAARFDQVTVTPAFAGAALHSEDLGNYTIPGSSSVSSGTTTVTGFGSHDSSGGHFRYQQVWGDCVITARLMNHSGTTRSAQSGIVLRDTTDNGAFCFYGDTSVDGFQVDCRSVPAGSPTKLETGGSLGNWIRLVRRGSIVAAFRAANVNGAPGQWTQVSGDLPLSLSAPLLVGLLTDSESSSAAIGTYTNFTVEPLNTVPVVNPGIVSSFAPFALTATVTDDGLPALPGMVAVQWSRVSGPGNAVFANPDATSTLLTLSQSGQHRLRLTADDGNTKSFSDLVFSGYLNGYDQWHDLSFVGGLTNPAGALLEDPDQDGMRNLMEYAFGLTPTSAAASPIVTDRVVVGQDSFLRIDVPRSASATGLSWIVEATSDLTNPASWSSDGLVVEVNTPTRLRVRDFVPAAPGVRRFMRVRVLRL